MNFNDNDLIEAVRAKPKLYDKTNLGFKNTAIKDAAWEFLAQFILTTDGIPATAEVVKTRWNNLRDRYSREKKAVEAKSRSGAASFSSRWPHFASMAFLDEHIRSRPSRCNVSSPSPCGLSSSQHASTSSSSSTPPVSVRFLPLAASTQSLAESQSMLLDLSAIETGPSLPPPTSASITVLSQPPSTHTSLSQASTSQPSLTPSQTALCTPPSSLTPSQPRTIILSRSQFPSLSEALSKSSQPRTIILSKSQTPSPSQALPTSQTPPTPSQPRTIILPRSQALSTSQPQPAPSQPTPSQPAPSQPAPSQPTPSQPAPSQPTPSQPAPSTPSQPRTILPSRPSTSISSQRSSAPCLPHLAPKKSKADPAIQALNSTLKSINNEIANRTITPPTPDDADTVIGKGVEAALRGITDPKLKVEMRIKFRQLINECEERSIL